MAFIRDRRATEIRYMTDPLGMGQGELFQLGDTCVGGFVVREMRCGPPSPHTLIVFYSDPEEGLSYEAEAWVIGVKR